MTFNSGSRCIVSIIIPFYNRCEMTYRCIQSIADCTGEYKKNQDNDFAFEVILVDDASQESSVIFERKGYSWLRLLRNDKNLGFARSCNRGAATAKGEYLVFLNNDTIAINGWLAELVRAMETNPLVGIVGSKLLYTDETIQHAGVVFDEEGMPFHIYRYFPSNFSGVNKAREFQAVTGACFIIKADLFHALGGFDERYLNGLEDIDLCLRVRAKGRKVLYCPTSTLYHLEYQTRGLDASGQEKNVALFQETWGREIYSDCYRYYKEDFITDASYEIAQIKKAACSNERLILVVWGAGSGGRRAVRFLRWIGIHPVLFVDNAENKWGAVIEGLPVNNPEYLLELKKQGHRVFIIVASLWFRKIMHQLIQMGFQPSHEFLTYPIAF